MSHACPRRLPGPRKIIRVLLILWLFERAVIFGRHSARALRGRAMRRDRLPLASLSNEGAGENYRGACYGRDNS